jgi:hypothetical protein
MKLFLFLYSTQNIVGSLLSIAALGLFFGGIIDDWWLLIVAGCYAIGWFAVPSDKELELRVRNEATQANLIGSVDDLIKQSHTKLPREAVERLEKIKVVVSGLAPMLFSGGVAMSSSASLVNAVTRDLPETVQNYMRLPSAFATLHVIENGKTCKQLLLEQLGLLNDQLDKIATSIFKNDAEALVVNGKFLQEKFHAYNFIG